MLGGWMHGWMDGCMDGEYPWVLQTTSSTWCHGQLSVKRHIKDTENNKYIFLYMYYLRSSSGSGQIKASDGTQTRSRLEWESTGSQGPRVLPSEECRLKGWWVFCIHKTKKKTKKNSSVHESHLKIWTLVHEGEREKGPTRGVNWWMTRIYFTHITPPAGYMACL